METITQTNQTDMRLAELQVETQRVIDTYLKQVTADANSPTVKMLRSKLKDLRDEQWRLLK